MRLLSILLFFIILHLAGCVTPYDPYEYRGFVHLSSLAYIGDCSKESVNRMLEESVFLKHYTQYKPNEQAIVDAADELHSMLQEMTSALKTRDTLSTTYCGIKMNAIMLLSGRYAQVVGAKNR